MRWASPDDFGVEGSLKLPRNIFSHSFLSFQWNCKTFFNKFDHDILWPITLIAILQEYVHYHKTCKKTKDEVTKTVFCLLIFSFHAPILGLALALPIFSICVFVPHGNCVCISDAELRTRMVGWLVGVRSMVKENQRRF